MFDISFSELLIIGIVALVVIGPERLPKVTRTVGHLLGRAQRYVNDVKGDIQREVELEELRKMKQEMESAANSVQDSFQQTTNSIHQDFKQPLDQLEKDIAQAKAEFDALDQTSLDQPNKAINPPTVTTEPVAQPSDSTLSHTNPAVTQKAPVSPESEPKT